MTPIGHIDGGLRKTGIILTNVCRNGLQKSKL